MLAVDQEVNTFPINIPLVVFDIVSVFVMVVVRVVSTGSVVVALVGTVVVCALLVLVVDCVVSGGDVVFVGTVVVGTPRVLVEV